MDKGATHRGGGSGQVSPELAATVKSIVVYPVKSCRGISVPQAAITSTVSSYVIDVPTINQDNGVPGMEPTEALQALRSDEVLRPSHKNQRRVYFGQNLVCKESLSAKDEGKIIKVGDPVYVLESFPSSDEAPA